MGMGIACRSEERNSRRKGIFELTRFVEVGTRNRVQESPKLCLRYRAETTPVAVRGLLETEMDVSIEIKISLIYSPFYQEP
jgi:hypothetical protein